MGSNVQPIVGVTQVRNHCINPRFYYYSKDVANHIKTTYSKNSGAQGRASEQKKQEKNYIPNNPAEPGRRLDRYV